MPDVLTEVRKRRGPFTRVVIALVVAWWVLGVVRMVLAVVSGLPPLEAAARHAQDLVSVPVILVLLLLAVADVWVRPRLENAVRLTRQATWVGSLAVGTSIAVGVAGLWSPSLRSSDRALEVADIVVSSVVPVLLCVVLATVAGAARRAGQGDEAPPSGAAAESAGTNGAEEETAAGTDASTAVPGGGTPAAGGEVARREPDPTAGAAWHSAADAAHGREAMSWGDTTTPFGWESGPGAAPLESAGAQGAGPDDPSAERTPRVGEPGDRASSTATPETNGKAALGPGRIDPDLWRTPGSDPR